MNECEGAGESGALLTIVPATRVTPPYTVAACKHVGEDGMGPRAPGNDAERAAGMIRSMNRVWRVQRVCIRTVRERERRLGYCVRACALSDARIEICILSTNLRTRSTVGRRTERSRPTRGPRPTGEGLFNVYHMRWSSLDTAQLCVALLARRSLERSVSPLWTCVFATHWQIYKMAAVQKSKSSLNQRCSDYSKKIQTRTENGAPKYKESWPLLSNLCPSRDRH